MNPAAVDVSVLTPSLGYGRFLGDCLASVAQQQGVTVEHLVQDGGSDDETLAILEGAGPHVRWASAPDRGQSEALNRALRRATGRWVGWLNADEFYLPDALAALVAAGDRSGAAVVYGDSVIVDEDGRFLTLRCAHRFSATALRGYGCFIATCAVLFRRDALPADPWAVELRRRMDWDLFMALAARGARFRYVRTAVGAFRRHPAQVTAAHHSAFFAEDERAALRHRMPADRFVRWEQGRRGRRAHRALKLLDGGWLRERLAAHRRGQDLRWFAAGVSS